MYKNTLYIIKNPHHSDVIYKYGYGYGWPHCQAFESDLNLTGSLLIWALIIMDPELGFSFRDFGMILWIIIWVLVDLTLFKCVFRTLGIMIT